MRRDEIKFFTKRQEVIGYLNQILPVIKNETVSGIYLYEDGFINGFLSFRWDNTATTILERIAIVFEKHFLYLSTIFASELSVGLMELTDDDKKEISELSNLINNETFVYGPGYKDKCIVTTRNIDRIKGFDVEKLDHPIDAWDRSGDVSEYMEDVVYEDGFNRITLFFEGDNAMKFIAEDAMSDGYMDLQIKDIDYHEVRMDDPDGTFYKAIGKQA